MSFSFCPVCAAWTLSRRPRDPGIRNVLVTLAFVVDRGCACGGYLAIAPSPLAPQPQNRPWKPLKLWKTTKRVFHEFQQYSTALTTNSSASPKPKNKSDRT